MVTQPIATADVASTSPVPVLDAQALRDLSELDPKGQSRLLQRVLKAFQVSAARLMPQLEAARRAGDLATVRLVAHTLKSSSGSIGALRLARISAQVESLIRTDATDSLGASIDELRAAMAEVLHAIERVLEAGA